MASGELSSTPFATGVTTPQSDCEGAEAIAIGRYITVGGVLGGGGDVSVNEQALVTACRTTWSLGTWG